MKHAWMLAFLTAMCFAQDKTADKKFWTVTAFSAASTAADADTTANFGPRLHLRRSRTPDCTESSPQQSA